MVHAATNANAEESKRSTILIVDDALMNRTLLKSILQADYDILEACDGVEAIAMLGSHLSEITLVVLDIVMPRMDGFEVLAKMNREGWIDEIPVVTISSENSPSYIKRAYDLGVVDYINRPFDTYVVQKRVSNTIMLYAKQNRLVDLVSMQMFEKEKNSNLMVAILSHIVEFRNGESGLHVMHVNVLTEILLKAYIRKTGADITPADVALIVAASSLHDIGKIAIDEKILNKPGRLTPEEFEIMKTHSAIGSSMLEDLPFYGEEPLIHYANQICRWHHERWDGRGYPDGLKGDEIPIAAQIVSMADVYDALTSDRVYKKAFSHEKSMEMILNGECGTFNPILLECLQDCAEEVQKELKVSSFSRNTQREMEKVAAEASANSDLTSMARIVSMFNHERAKSRYFAQIHNSMQFDYLVASHALSLSEVAAEKLGLPETVSDPLTNDKAIAIFGIDAIQKLRKAIMEATPANPDISLPVSINVDGQTFESTLQARCIWSSADENTLSNVIGLFTFK